jgi:hypothetical protein
MAGGPGPRGGSGEACLKEGDGECSEGEPEESVDALNGLSGLSCGRRIGNGPGRDGRSYEMDDKEGANHTRIMKTYRAHAFPTESRIRHREAGNLQTR